MKIYLKRTGGAAGITKKWEIDLSALPSEKTFEFKKLLAAANFFALGANLATPVQARDSFCYELTVEEKEKCYTAKCSEENIPKPFRDCLDWVAARKTSI